MIVSVFVYTFFRKQSLEKLDKKWYEVKNAFETKSINRSAKPLMKIWAFVLFRSYQLPQFHVAWLYMVEYWETMQKCISIWKVRWFFSKVSLFVCVCIHSFSKRFYKPIYTHGFCKYDNDVNDKIVGNFEYIWEKIEGTKLLLKYVSCVSLYLCPLFQKTAYASFYCAMQFTFERKLNWNCTNVQ